MLTHAGMLSHKAQRIPAQFLFVAGVFGVGLGKPPGCLPGSQAIIGARRQTQFFRISLNLLNSANVESHIINENYCLTIRYFHYN